MHAMHRGVVCLQHWHLGLNCNATQLGLAEMAPGSYSQGHHSPNSLVPHLLFKCHLTAWRAEQTRPLKGKILSWQNITINYPKV